MTKSDDTLIADRAFFFIGAWHRRTNGLSMRISARSPREHMVAAMGGFNAAADLGFFPGPVAGGILA